MSKINLPDITSGYNLSLINNNFQKIEDALNQEVLYRTSHVGEPNEMETNLDMNGKEILNVHVGSAPGSLATKGYVDQEISEERAYVDQQLAEVDAQLATYTPLAYIGAPFGVAPLDGSSKVPISNLPHIATSSLLPTTIESIRRSYAEAGYNMVPGSFENGGTLVNANDVLLWELSGVAYAYSGTLPHTISVGETPVGNPLWVARSAATLRSELTSAGRNPVEIGQIYDRAASIQNVTSLRLVTPLVSGQVFKLKQYVSGGVGGGDFIYDSSDTTSPDDNGWVIVTSGGHRLKRAGDKSVVYAADFGAVAGGALDAPLANAIATASSLGVTKIIIPIAPVSNPMTLVGGLSFNTPASSIEIAGPGGWFSSCISHSGNNIGLTFTKGPSTNLFSSAAVSGVRVIGNGGATAGFVEFQDSWRHRIKDIYGSGYTLGALVTLHNRTGWTENFTAENIMSRENKSLFKFKCTPASGGTGSFYGLTTKEVWHQFGVAGSMAFDLSAGTGPADAMALYGSDIDIGGWFEAGGGHRVFVVDAYNLFVDSKVLLRLDGFGGLTDGSDLWSFRTGAATAKIDIECNFLSQQAGSIDLSAMATGSVIGSVRHLVVQNNKFDFLNARPCCRVKGAKIRFIQSGISTDKTLIIDQLPAYSVWKATLTVDGPNAEFVEEYRIEVGEANWLARVVSLGVPPTATTDTISPNIRLQAVGGGTGGGFSASGGGRFEWKLFAATGGGTYQSTLELEML